MYCAVAPFAVCPSGRVHRKVEALLEVLVSCTVSPVLYSDLSVVKSAEGTFSVSKKSGSFSFLQPFKLNKSVRATDLRKSDFMGELFRTKIRGKLFVSIKQWRNIC